MDRKEQVKENIAKKFWLAVVNLNYVAACGKPSEYSEDDFDKQVLIDKQPYYDFAGQIDSLYHPTAEGEVREKIYHILKNDECSECALSSHLWNGDMSCLNCKGEKVIHYISLLSRPEGMVRLSKDQSLPTAFLYIFRSPQSYYEQAQKDMTTPARTPEGLTAFRRVILEGK
jgi:hypothetical protein